MKSGIIRIGNIIFILKKQNSSDHFSILAFTFSKFAFESRFFSPEIWFNTKFQMYNDVGHQQEKLTLLNIFSSNFPIKSNTFSIRIIATEKLIHTLATVANPQYEKALSPNVFASKTKFMSAKKLTHPNVSRGKQFLAFNRRSGGVCESMPISFKCPRMN